MSIPYIRSLWVALCFSLFLVGCGGSSSSSPDDDITPPPTETPGDDDSQNDDTQDGDSSGGGHDIALDYELDFDHLYALAEFPVGMAISAGNEPRSLFRSGERGAQEREVVEQHFNQLTAGNIMKMSYLHNQWGQYTFDQADELVDYAQANGMTVHGHALAWHSCYQIPQWVRDFDGDPKAFWHRMYTHAETITEEYAGRVVSWDVVNEAFLDSGEYREGIEDCGQDGERSPLYLHADGPAFIEAAFQGARAGDPEADLYYNDFNLVPNDDKLASVLTMVDDFLERDIPIDGIGFQMHIHIGWPSIENIRASFEQVVERGLKVKITELDIPYYNPFSNDEPPYEFDQEVAQMQKQRYCEVVEAYLDVVPAEQRGGLSIWGLVDGDSWLNDHFFDGEESYPLLFTDDLEPKPALEGVADALRGNSCTD